MNRPIFLFRFLLMQLLIMGSLSISSGRAQKTEKANYPINLKTLEKRLSIAMREAFPYLTYDQCLTPILQAKSQTEAGAPSCYGTHFGKYINPVGNERLVSEAIVKEYKEFLVNRIFLKEDAIKGCHFKTFCVIAVKENSLVHVELIINNDGDIPEL